MTQTHSIAPSPTPVIDVTAVEPPRPRPATEDDTPAEETAAKLVDLVKARPPADSSYWLG